MGAPRKRPACAKAASGKQSEKADEENPKAKEELPETPTVMASGMVTPLATVQLLTKAAGLRRSDKSNELEWASAFDGTGMPSYALKLLSVPDMSSTFNGSGYCYVHNHCCEVPTTSPMLLCAGFLCKSSSLQNGSRWVKDPVAADSASWMSFQDTMKLLQKANPRFFILENVQGCKFPGAPRKRRAPEDESATQSPKDVFDEVISKELPNFNVQCINLDSAPMAEQVSRISAAAKTIPRQSLQFYFDQSSVAEVGVPESQEYDGTREVAYTQHFATQMQKAIEAGRIPKTAVPKHRHLRPSSVCKALQCMPPGTQAIADVALMILVEKHGDLENLPVAIADVSQSSDRLKLSVTGIWGTITTSSKLFDFKSEKLLDARMQLQLLGIDVKDVMVTWLKDKEITDMAGNAMSISQCTQVLLPLLSHLGQAKKEISVLWVAGGGLASPLLLDEVAWPGKSVAEVKLVEFALDPARQQARVLYDKNFAKVACLQTSSDIMNVKCLASVIVAGRAPTSKKAFEWFLKSWKEFSHQRGVKIVLVLSSPRPPSISDPASCGWVFGSHEINWSLFSCFDTSCYVTIFCQAEQQGSNLAKALAHEMAKILQLPHVHGTNKHVNEQLPKTESTDKKDLKILAAAQKLERLAGTAQASRFIDASNKSLPVKLGIPDPKKASLPLSIAQDGSVNRVCLLEALGYKAQAANLSLLSEAAQQSILASTVPAAVAATMLNAVARFL
ncbi:Nek5 [Symbiodinium sp. CCMP2592]|nr:Nek5 [Symbiodinium sp. CCMP2592]